MYDTTGHTRALVTPEILLPAFNCLFFIIGIVVVNVNPAYRLHELKHALNLVELEGIIVLEQVKTSKYLEMLQKLIPEMEKIEPNSDARIRSTEVFRWLFVGTFIFFFVQFCLKLREIRNVRILQLYVRDCQLTSRYDSLRLAVRQNASGVPVPAKAE